MAEERNLAEEIDFLAGAIQAQRSLDIALMGALMAQGIVTSEHILFVLSELMETSAQDPNSPQFNAGRQESWQAIHDAISEIARLRGL